VSVAQAFDDEGLWGRIDAWLHALRLPEAAAHCRSLAQAMDVSAPPGSQ